MTDETDGQTVDFTTELFDTNTMHDDVTNPSRLLDAPTSLFDQRRDKAARLRQPRPVKRLLALESRPLAGGQSLHLFRPQRGQGTQLIRRTPRSKVHQPT